jgi:hypothetical protein
MKTGRCSYCNQTGPLQADHPTLRDERGRPNDPDFVVWSCASCNKTRWHAFRVAGGERFSVHPVAYRQAAGAFFFNMSADAGRDLTLTVAQQRAVGRLFLDGATLIVGLLALVGVLVFGLWSAR